MAIETDRGDDDGASIVWSLLGWIVALLLLGLVLGIWWVYARRPDAAFFVPAPEKAWSELIGLLDAKLWRATRATLVAWAGGFIAAGVFGIGLGMVSGSSGRFSALVTPTLTLFSAFPVLVGVLTLVIWAGFNSYAYMAAAAILLALFPMAAIVAHGWRGGGARLPAVFRALEVGAVLALAGVLFAQMAAGSNHLGSLAFASVAALDLPKLFAFALYLWLLGLLLALPFAFARWLAGRRR